MSIDCKRDIGHSFVDVQIIGVDETLKLSRFYRARIISERLRVFILGLCLDKWASASATFEHKLYPFKTCQSLKLNLRESRQTISPTPNPLQIPPFWPLERELILMTLNPKHRLLVQIGSISLD